MISVSPRGWDAIKDATMPRFYFDLALTRDSLKKGQTPWTPAVSIVFGLAVGVEMMQAEGLDNVYRRHARVGRRRAIAGVAFVDAA